MRMHRHHYLLLGVLLIVLGVQFRVVESVVLTEKAAVFIAKNVMGKPVPEVATDGTEQTGLSTIPVDKRTIKYPHWIGFALLSVGAVLVLHSWAMSKSD